MNNDLRLEIVQMVKRSGEGHIPSSFSVIDIIDYIYENQLNYDNTDLSWTDRDYFILSKGHGCLGFYTALHEIGLITKDDLINKENKKSTIVLNRVLPRARLTEAMILRLRYSGASIARSKISSRVIFAETFTVGRGVTDISVTTQPSKEVIKLGNEIVRKLR